MDDEQIEYLEISLAKAKTQLEKSAALDRLVSNKDFKLVVDDGYFTEEASNAVLALAAPMFAGEAEQKRLHNNIIAIGCLRHYFSGIMQLGVEANKAIKEHELMREELLTEEDE